MLKPLNRSALMLAMLAAGLGLLVTPVMFEDFYAPAAMISSGTLGAVTALVAIGIGYGSLVWWSRFALGVGTWTLVAPMLLGFYQGGAGFWAHIIAGLVSLLSGVAGHELIERAQRSPQRA
jgi:hypothetical protein